MLGKQPRYRFGMNLADALFPRSNDENENRDSIYIRSPFPQFSGCEIAKGRQHRDRQAGEAP